MFESKSGAYDEQVVGDDWKYPYVIHDRPTIPAPVVATSTSFEFYKPEAPHPVVDPDTLPFADLTGFVPNAVLTVPGRAPIPISADTQDDDNLLSNGQFRFIVPHALTETFTPDPLGTLTPGCSLHVTLTDPRGLIETVEILRIRVVGSG